MNGWELLEATPRVGERGQFSLRGLEPDCLVEIGEVRLFSDAQGRVVLPSFQSTSLQNHVGLLDVVVDNRVMGTVEVVPEKLSYSDFTLLLADLHSVWAGLVVGDHEAVSIGLASSTAAVLWQRVEQPIDHVLRSPRESIEIEMTRLRLDTVRRPRELTRSVAHKSVLELPGWGQRLVRTISEPELDLVYSTLRGLCRLADAEGDSITSAAVRRRLRNPLLERCTPGPVRLTWGMRSDDRYRRILAVYHDLERVERQPVLGPAEVREGARAVPRLYEYWVFLQALRLAESIYGQPSVGYAALARPLDDGRRLLELPAGTSVDFPGGVSVVFEPVITARDGWGEFTLNPHPDPSRPVRFSAQPDVVILRRGLEPVATVLDAKYIQAHFIDRSSVDMHHKYARLMWAGRAVVSDVLVVHPHDRRPVRWAGYGAVPWRPGHPCAPVPLLDSSVVVRVEPPEVVPDPPAPARVRRRRVLLDQYSTHAVAQHHPKDMRPLLQRVCGGVDREQAIAVVPDIPALASFGGMLKGHGWHVSWCKDLQRETSLGMLLELAREAPDDVEVVIVSDDPVLQERVRGLDQRVDFFTGFSELPDLHLDEPEPPRVMGPGLGLDAEGARYFDVLLGDLQRRPPSGWDSVLGKILDDLGEGRAYDQQLSEGDLELSMIGQLVYALSASVLSLPPRPVGLAATVRRLLGGGGSRRAMRFVEGRHAPHLRRIYRAGGR